MAEEYLDVLNEKGEKTGESLSYKEVHKNGLIHLTARVYFLNSKNQILLQKRSANKKIYPGLWDAGVGGHVSSGESSIEGAQKETREEIGLEIPAEEYNLLVRVRAQKFKHFEDFIDNEFNDIYIVHRDIDISDLTMEKNEIDEVGWYDVETFEKWVNGPEKILAGNHDEEYATLISHLKGLPR